MQAAAHTPGGYGGVPQAVGKEYTAADSMDAAGVALLADGKVLLLKRGASGDYAGHWCLPGGKAEPGEGGEQAAMRECQEETGFLVPGPMRQLGMTDNGAVRFTTFGRVVSEFEPVLCDEHTEFMWAAPGALPEPMHPGTKLFLDGGALAAIDPRGMNELDVARAIAAGEMTSPQRFGNMALFALRITGTGMAYRSGENEHVWRDPSIYLNDNFLQRCNGLQVIYIHPPGAVLTSKEFSQRTIGAIFLPYLQGDEVWGIAKVYDDEAIDLMTDPEKPLSTSPTVVFRKSDGNSTVELEDGQKLLIEGEPSLLDHLAVCPQGVWDKGGEPAGILLTNDEASKMADENKATAKADADPAEKDAPKADADGGNMKAIMDSLGALAKRMDSMEEAAKPAKVAADADESEEAKKAKADADKESEKEAEAKADAAFIARVDAAVAARLPKQASDEEHAAMADAQARCDSVASAFGSAAPRPLQGESPLAYRRRLVGAYKEHSPAWKGVDITAITDPAMLGIAETQIYADAMTAAMNPAAPEGETLREVQTKSRAGHSVSTFVGNPAAWTSQFKLPARRVQQINKGA